MRIVFAFILLIGLGLAGLIAFNITKGSGAESIDGLAQRAFALCVLIWLAATSVKLYRGAATVRT